MYPKDVWTYWFLYTYQNIIRDFNGCAETLKKAREVTGNPAPVYNILGYTYMELGEQSEVAAAFDKYIELAPNNPNVYDSKGDYFMNIKEYRKAYDSYMKAYSLEHMVDKKSTSGKTFIRQFGYIIISRDGNCRVRFPIIRSGQD